MGRFRRKRYFKKNKKKGSSSDDADGESSNNNDDTNNNNLWFHWRTREDLLRYLEEYREGCWQFYQRIKTAELMALDDDELEVVDQEAPSSNNELKKNKNAGDEERVIGGISFPALTDAVFQEPYLKLPKELAKKQRSIVHEACIEKDLYHDSFAFGEDRNLVISLYADGFESLLGQQTPPVLAFDAHKCKPWYCRRRDDENNPVGTDEITTNEEEEEKKENSNVVVDLTPIKPSVGLGSLDICSLETPVVSNRVGSGGSSSRQRSFQGRAEEEAVNAIFKLIDQPGVCIREEHDFLVYEELEGASLAHIEPPSPNNDKEAWMLVDSAAKMKLCVQELTSCHPTEIAFDLEAFNVNKYTQLTCLLQVTSNAGKEYVIDTLAPGVWDQVHGLAPLFADPGIIKIGHSTGSLDVRSLHRDFGIFVVNLFDTYEAAKEMGLDSLGLAAVCEHYGLRDVDTYLDLKATYQSCDWRVRPLTHSMIQYGRYDIHFLIQLRRLMMRDMVQADFWGLSGMNNVAGTAEKEDRLVAESLSHTLAQIEFAEMDTLQGENKNENGETFQPPETKHQEDVLAFLTEEEMEGTPAADDATFKTAMNMSRSEDDTFYTPYINSRDASFLDDTFDDDEERGLVVKQDITAADLRLQPVLMRVVSISQERCRALWKASQQQHRNNARFQSLIKRAKRQFVTWEPSSTDLYDELCHWRARVAEELECLPGFVAPLDFLVAVAWKRPTTAHGLRRISTRLPAVLEQYPKYCDQLLERVLRCVLENGGAPAGNVVFYSNLNLNSKHGDNVTTKSRGFGVAASKLLSFDTALKVFVASVICQGVVLAILDAKRKRR